MSDTPQDVPERFVIYEGKNCRPRLFRFRFAGTSPKGKYRYWDAIDTTEPFQLKYPRDPEPARTVDEAVDEFQELVVRIFGFDAIYRPDKRPIREGVQLIIASEALRPKKVPVEVDLI